MFSRLATVSQAEERPEIYSLLMVGLGLMAHIMFIFGVIIGVMVVMELGQWVGASPLEPILTIAVITELFRFPVILARSQARRAFGVDQRSFGARLRRVLGQELAGVALVTLLTWLILSLLGVLSLINWAIVLFLVTQILVWAPVLFQRLEWRLYPYRFRLARPEETPENLTRIIKSLPLPKGWELKRVLIHLGRSGPLPWPKIVGQDLIIPQRALEMPPGALRHRIVTAVLGRLVKADSLIMVLKALTMSLIVPLSLVFLGSLGFLWRFPQEFSPVLVPCLWLAAGTSHFISRAMVRFVRRLLERKLAAAAVLATWDVPGFKASLEVASRWDLEPDGTPWWFWFSRTRPGAIEQIEQIKEQLQVFAKVQSRSATPLEKKPAI
ncbi:MAG: hypothetical protein LBS60_02925 [Deltaproteobacteria bacterium]|jgi:hypothetical protein|nr:hypothetical protein [Deltaproteobacteria bacterium]